MNRHLGIDFTNASQNGRVRHFSANSDFASPPLSGKESGRFQGLSDNLAQAIPHNLPSRTPESP
jgi:hypothetical protein